MLALAPLGAETALSSLLPNPVTPRPERAGLRAPRSQPAHGHGGDQVSERGGTRAKGSRSVPPGFKGAKQRLQLLAAVTAHAEMMANDGEEDRGVIPARNDLRVLVQKLECLVTADFLVSSRGEHAREHSGERVCAGLAVLPAPDAGKRFHKFFQHSHPVDPAQLTPPRPGILPPPGPMVMPGRIIPS